MREEGKRTYAMIIGAMKCGTSSLYQYLIEHPQICACRVAEPEYFSEFQGHGIETNSYEELWEFHPEKHTYCLEKSTGYTKYPEEASAPANIAAHGLKPRFIYIVRDPVERVESDYNYMQQHPNLRVGSDPLTRNRVYRSKYFLQLQRFLEHFPEKERYLVMRLEELKDNPEEIVGRVFSFLGLPGCDEIDYQVYNETAQVSSLEQWFRRPGLYQIRNLIPSELRQPIRRGLRRLTGSARRELTSAERQKLRERLRDDMRQLRKHFGVDVQAWGFGEAE